MKKLLVYTIAAGSIFAVSCSKEGTEPLQDKNRIRVIEGSQLNNELKPMDQQFNLQGKASSQSYTYRAFAEPPIINGVKTAATGVTRRGNFVYVTWHTPGADFGGAVSAYAYDPLTNGFNYVNRVDFVDSDWHDLDAATGTNVYLAGSRNPDASGYSHGGAVVARLGVNGTTGALNASYLETPLVGFAANGVAFETGSNIHVGTGDGDGYIYKTNFNMVRVDSNFRGNIEHIATDGTHFAALKGNKGPGSGNVEVYRYDVAEMSTGASAQVLGWTGLNSADLDRNALEFYGDKVLVALDNGLVEFDFGATSINVKGDFPGQPRGVAADELNQLVYFAAGEGGLMVLNGPDVVGSEYDVQGSFVPPTGGIFEAAFDVKDAEVDDEFVFLSVGSGGVFFITRD